MRPMVEDLNKLAREIVTKNQYMVLGTAEKEGSWVSPVAYAFDKHFNFYFVSIPTSRHSINITKNKNVSVSIYDSRQKWGYGVGLQAEGTVSKCKLTEIPKVATLYFDRKYPYGSVTGAFVTAFKNLLKNKTYFFYKFVPTKTWINNPNEPTDVRAEVQIYRG